MDKTSMRETITDELSEDECESIVDSFDCENCSEIEECFVKASKRLSSAFAKLLDFNGWDSECDFWENLD